MSGHVLVGVVVRAGENEASATSEQSQWATAELCDEWTRLGVGLVASHKRIHPFLLLLGMEACPFDTSRL
jgi:hypothetical protein